MTKTATNKKVRSKRKSDGWKGKSTNSVPSRGQWKVPNSDDDESAVGFVHLGVKLRPAEKTAFQTLCKRYGVTPNKAVRTFVRNSAGYLELSDEALDCLLTITRQISGVSTNINQIAKAGNRTLTPDYIAFMEDRRELGAQLARLEDLMRKVINVAKRRSDGLRQLEDVLEAK